MLEIHSALKLLNKNISKTTNDNKDWYDLLNKEIQDYMFNVSQQMGDLKKKIDVEDTAIEDRVQL